MQKRVNHVRWHQKPKLERTFWTDSSDKNTKLEILFGNTLKAVTIKIRSITVLRQFDGQKINLPNINMALAKYFLKS